MRINTNISSLVSYNSLARTTGKLEKSIARLSTGLKISNASDDAAGLAISEKMRAQTKGLDRAYQNAQDGISLLQTAEGAIGDIHDALQRMRELSVHAANGAITDDDRIHIQQQVDQLISHINDIATQTQFNKKKLLDGSAAVLWSTDSLDLGIKVSGTLKYLDKLGAVQSAAGNYKITFSETVTGTENIQKSNILTLKHGTHSTNVAFNVSSDSGLANLQAINMVEGEWRLETRETPFGGVTYYIGDAKHDPAEVGGVLTATNAPSIVAPGEYDVRLSNKVPMMAEFKDAYTSGAVDGITLSSHNASRDMDVQMSTAINATGTGTTQFDNANWNHSGENIQVGNGTAGDISVGINDQTTANVFTHYQVANTDRRDLSGGAVSVTESYVVSDAATIGVELTYMSVAGTAAAATLTYQSVAGQIGYTSTWGATGGAFTIDYTDGVGDPAQFTTTIAAGASITAIRDAINGDTGLQGRNISASVTTTANGRSTLTLSNGSGAAITVGGAQATAMGLGGTYTTTGAGRNRSVTVDNGYSSTRTIAANTSLSTIAANLNADLGSRATVADPGASATGTVQLTVTGAGAANGGNNTIAFSGTALDDIGLSGKTLTGTGTGTASSDALLNGRVVDIDTGNKNIADIAASLQTAIRGAHTTANNITVGTSGIAGDLTIINIANSSKYRLQITGDTIRELNNGNDQTMNREVLDALDSGVYDGVTFETAIIKNADGTVNGRMNDVRTALNNTIAGALNADGLSGNNGFGGTESTAVFTANSAGGMYTIRVDNVAAIGYQISLKNGAHTDKNALDEMWTTPRDIARGGTGASSAMAFERNAGNIAGTAAGQTMEQVYAAIENQNAFNLKVDWNQPLFDPRADGNHYGSFSIQNTSNNDSGDARRSYTLEMSGTANVNAKDANRSLFSGGMDLTYGNTKNTDIWQTRDAVRLTVTYEGNWANGNAIGPQQFTVGTSTGSTNYDHRNRPQDDWLWEGDAYEAGLNKDKMNAHIGGVLGNDFYTNFFIADGTTNASDVQTGDRWMMFTQARSGDSTNLTVTTGDSKADGKGGQVTVTYAFNDGVLSNSGDQFNINQMLYRDGVQEHLQHRIDFGTEADNKIALFSYGERKNAGDYSWKEWGNENTNHTDAWYSHTYYGEDTTYFFHNASDPSVYLHNIEVHRQNDVNASIMFTMDNGILRWNAKTVDDAGNQVETNGKLTEAEAASASRDAPGLLIAGVWFTNFDVNFGGMQSQDKFVVNVAAAAKTETLATDGDDTKFMSYENVSITGDPFQQGNERTGSSAQYRLKDNTGAASFPEATPLKMLGYFVSPINGSNATKGVGYYDGSLQLAFDPRFNGLPGMKVGVTNNEVKDAGAYRIHAEVNYQGKTQYSAGALVTSGYFQSMEIDNTRVLADFVKGIGYSDYEYTMIGTTWNVANGNAAVAENYKYTKVNGSMIFDVTNIEGNVLTFRVQGHFIDREGKEYYGEEEEFKLHTGANTERDTARVDPQGTGEEDVHSPVRLFSDIMFADQEYGGIFLDEVTLGDIDIWTVGDRFTVTLTASGFEDGTSIDDQNKDLMSSIDEINLFSDNRGSTMPHTFRFDDGVLDNSTTDLRIYQLSNNFVKTDSDKFYKDQVMDGTLRLSFNEYNPRDPKLPPYDPADKDPAGGNTRVVHTAATFEVVYGQGDDYGVAHYYSNVEDIAQFWDKNGRYILDGGLETLTIKQGDRETQVNIGQGWEVGELTEALSRAVWNDLLKQHQEGLKGEGELLDMAADKEYMLSKDDMRDIIQFVNTVPGKNDMNSVVGTIVAHSVLSGEGKSLEFYGSVDLQNALGFNTIQQGTDTVFNANVSDAHSGKMVTAHNRVVAGTTSYDLLLGEVGLAVDSDLGITRAVYDEVSGTFKLDVKDQFDQYVHLVDNAMTLQIGANEGEDMFLTLGDMSADTLGVASINVRSREAAARAITMIDNAISRVSYQRAIVGAQINRLEHTMSNLANTSLNLQESRSRIVDVNLASEMMNRTKLDIVTQAGAAMLVQANQMGSNILTLLR